MSTKINTKKYIEKYVKIKNKKAEIVNFKLNTPQNKLYEVIKQQHEKGKPIRIIILKARQMGFSTLTESIIFKNTVTNFNVKAGIVTHCADATNNLYEMFKLMYEKLPEELKPEIKASNAKEIVFNNKTKTGLNSKIRCMTAGADGLGRSDTFQYLHISEYAFWPRDKSNTIKGLIQAVPNTCDSIIIIESTANGYEDFKDRWDKAVAGETDFVPVFVAWYELVEYSMTYTGFELTKEEKKLKKLYALTNEQLAWRRWCIRNNCDGSEDTFKQEYPSNPEEAFLMTGNCVFNKQKVQERINNIRNKKPLKKGFFNYDVVTNDYGSYELENITWINSKDGPIEIYELPKRGYPYAIGGDTALTGEDYYTCHVINNITKNQVAKYRKQQISEHEYAEQIACLGYMYNEALIGIETNLSTFPQERVAQLNYPNIYVTQKLTGEKTVIKEYGFKTTSVTRPHIIRRTYQDSGRKYRIN